MPTNAQVPADDLPDAAVPIDDLPERHRAASNEQRAQAARQWMSQQNKQLARKDFEERSPLEQFLGGVGKPFTQAYRGAKQLVTGEASPADQQARLYEGQMHGAPATAGEIAGNVGMLALPGAGVARALPKALARIAADAGMNAGVEALKDPGAGGSRLENAAWGGAGALAGSGIGAGVRGFAGGLRPTAQGAKELLDAGVPLTPGQMKGGVLQAAEQHAENVPFVGAGIRARRGEALATAAQQQEALAALYKQRQREALEAWNQKLLNEIVPEGQVTAAGHEGVKQAKLAFKSAYDRLWAVDIPMDTKGVADEWARISLAMPKGSQAEEVIRQLDRLHVDHIQNAGATVPGGAISRMDDALRELAHKSGKGGLSDAAEAFAKARGSLRASLPPVVSGELTRIDSLYRQFSVTRKAAGYIAAGNDGVFTPQQLLGASKVADKSAGKGAFATGTAPLQPQAIQAAEALQRRTAAATEDLQRRAAMSERVLGPPPRKPTLPEAAVATAIAGGPGYFEPSLLGISGVARAAYTKPGMRWLTGQAPTQRALRSFSDDMRARAMLDALRTFSRPSTIGASTTGALKDE